MRTLDKTVASHLTDSGGSCGGAARHVAASVRESATSKQVRASGAEGKGPSGRLIVITAPWQCGAYRGTTLICQPLAPGHLLHLLESLLEPVHPVLLEVRGTTPARRQAGTTTLAGWIDRRHSDPVPEHHAGNSRPRSRRSGPLRCRQAPCVDHASSESPWPRTAWSRRRRPAPTG
jgi:hypothetical protein